MDRASKEVASLGAGFLRFSVLSTAMRLKGKHALITGASGGIGAATAREFAREGVVGLGIQYTRSRERAESLASEVRDLGARPLLLPADLGSREAAKSLVDAFVREFGRIDALVCLAGHPFSREDWFADFESLTDAQLEGPLRTDLLGSVHAIQAAIPVFKRQSSGSIVLTASSPAITGDAVGISYLVAKAAILGLTKALAQSLGRFGVHVNAIAPGAVSTDSMSSLTKEEESELSKETALRRLGDPREIARKIVFLCSDDASFITGATIVVDGGVAMR